MDITLTLTPAQAELLFDTLDLRQNQIELRNGLGDRIVAKEVYQPMKDKVLAAVREAGMDIRYGSVVAA